MEAAIAALENDIEAAIVEVEKTVSGFRKRLADLKYRLEKIQSKFDE